jgi:hypothetical protein
MVNSLFSTARGALAGILWPPTVFADDDGASRAEGPLGDLRTSRNGREVEEQTD